MPWLFGGRYAILTVALNLRRGERYARKLDGLVPGANFRTPGGRIEALRTLAELVEEPDVVDGYAIQLGGMLSKEAAGERAERMAREQMEYIGIHPRAVNVVGPEGSGVSLEPSHERGRAHRTTADACVLSLAVTARRSAVRGMRTGGAAEALAALATLSHVSGADLDALYFFYAPNAGSPLDPATANRVFLDLQAAAHRA